jgi:hypothetical protein
MVASFIGFILFSANLCLLLNKKKIINDPVYGFITLHNDLLYEIVDHPIVQRLRRIKQTGLAELVYPGAVHSRFHHAVGAMNLMKVALDNLQSKGVFLYDQEIEGALIAILLHDLGHGPLSHSLEHLLIDVHHEEMSRLLIGRLNREFNGKLDLAIQIFNKRYPRIFFNQLVSSQLDVDRLDYLMRDSFYTGVSEGTIGADRILKMMQVQDDELVVEEKGIYNIENFLNARRLMYWQVYFHKTALCAEKMLQQIILRARENYQKNRFESSGSETLDFFLMHNIGQEEIKQDDILDRFIDLDDIDLWVALKKWSHGKDSVLADICSRILNRQLFRILIENEKPLKDQRSAIKNELKNTLQLKDEHLKYYCLSGTITNKAYVRSDQTIKIKMKSGQVIDVAQAADLPNIKAMSKIVKKHYLCFPKHINYKHNHS